MDYDEDEDSRRFLSMLDAAAERIFEACSEIMAAESSVIAVACNTEMVQQSLSDCLQHNEIYPELSLVNSNALPPASQASSYHSKSRKRRKRSWTSDQHVLEEASSATQINIGVNEKTCAFVGWPQNFTSSSYEASKALEEFKAKNNFTFTKKLNRHQTKGVFRSNIGSVGSSVNSVFAAAMLPPTVGNRGKSEAENTKKFDDYSKALDKIESLIPSLRKLVIGVQTPTEQFQGSRIMPCQRSENISNPKQTREQAAGKDKQSRFQSPDPSVGSSSFWRPE